MNFLAPTAAELEREWGQTLSDEWSTDVVAGDFAPIIRRFGVGEAAQREVVLARFGLQQASAKGVRAAGLDRERPHRDRGHPLRLQGRLGGPAVVHRPGAVLLRALLRRRHEEVGTLAHPPHRPLAAQHRRPLGPLGRRRRRDDAELLDPHPQLRPASPALALPSRDQRQGRAAGEAHPGAARRGRLRRLARHHAGPRADVLRHLQQGRSRSRAGAEQHPRGDDDDAVRHRRSPTSSRATSAPSGVSIRPRAGPGARRRARAPRDGFPCRGG